MLDPNSNEVVFFEAVALPFGSVSSVIAFNRVARALRIPPCSNELFRRLLSTGGVASIELCLGDCGDGDGIAGVDNF